MLAEQNFHHQSLVKWAPGTTRRVIFTGVSISIDAAIQPKVHDLAKGNWSSCMYRARHYLAKSRMYCVTDENINYQWSYIQ